jgi:hypothetical protein
MVVVGITASSRASPGVVASTQGTNAVPEVTVLPMKVPAESVS